MTRPVRRPRDRDSIEPASPPQAPPHPWRATAPQPPPHLWGAVAPQPPPQPPPQAHVRGRRQALDAAWLVYLAVAAPPTAPPKPHPLLAQGLAQLAEGHAFEAHETWEQAWRESPYPQRLFYLGLTKFAAAYAQAARGNVAGARRLLAGARAALAPFTGTYLGVDVVALADNAGWGLRAPAPKAPRKAAKRADENRDASPG